MVVISVGHSSTQYLEIGVLGRAHTHTPSVTLHWLFRFELRLVIIIKVQ